MEAKRVLVLGAGVSGLSTGILLLQKGYRVTIWARDLPPYTTSNKAAAVWYPFVCGPIHKVPDWARTTLDFFQRVILPDPTSGCKKQTVVEIFHQSKQDPSWQSGVDSYKRISKKYLPEGYTDGYEIEGLVMDTDQYVDYLVDTFKRLGGTIRQKTISVIQEAFTDYQYIVNCTGLGSRELFNDLTVYPCRGQIVKIKPTGLDYSLFEEEGKNSLAYIIPRLHDIILGGTIQDNNWSLEIDENDTKDILRRCGALFPEFSNPEILETRVGLRPSRPEIRLEIEKYSDNYVIHNYGHGGGGFTLSWGCAEDAAELVASLY